MVKEHAWMWVLGGVVVLYALGSSQRAQAAAAAAAAGQPAPATSGNILSNLFGGILGTNPATAPAAAASGGFYNPALPAPANYQPVNYIAGTSPNPYAGYTANQYEPLTETGGATPQYNAATFFAGPATNIA